MTKITRETSFACLLLIIFLIHIKYIQGVIESCTDILTTSYWLDVELGKNI
jgi:type III secretory pathway component EscT